MKFDKEDSDRVPSRLTQIDSEISQGILKIVDSSSARRTSLEKSKKEAIKPLYLSRYE